MNYFFKSQSIGSILFSIKKLFVREKGLLPKKPLLALKGEGWALSIIRWFLLVINCFLLRAKFPHNINTVGVSLLFLAFLLGCLVNENNPEDLLICKSSDEVNLTEVTDSEVIKGLLPKFYKSIREAKIIEKCLKMNENA